MRLLPPPPPPPPPLHAGTLECNPSPSDSLRCSTGAIQIADFMAMAAINLSFAGPIPSRLFPPRPFSPSRHHNIGHSFALEPSPSFAGLYVSDSALSVLEEPQPPPEPHKRRETEREREFGTTQWSFGIDIVHPSIRSSVRPSVQIS